MKFDVKAMKDLFERIAQNLAIADEAFRQTHEGYPVEVVRADANKALPIELTPEGLDAYAAAVAEGLPFRFDLRG